MVLLGRESPRNFAWGCAAQGLKFKSYSWPKYFNFNTLFQTLPLKSFRKICKIQIGPEKETYFRKNVKQNFLKPHLFSTSRDAVARVLLFRPVQFENVALVRHWNNWVNSKAILYPILPNNNRFTTGEVRHINRSR